MAVYKPSFWQILLQEDTDYISKHGADIFNATIINDDLDRAYEEFKQYLLTNFAGLKNAAKS